ncbi:Rho GTPase-activating protein [Pelomyxa schiedti]|nr:Rho GTPase-activating protein [Pelomyxa schiedti]
MDGTGGGAQNMIVNGDDDPAQVGELEVKGGKVKKWSRMLTVLENGVVRCFISPTEPEALSASLDVWRLKELDKKECPKTAPFGFRLCNPNDKKPKDIFMCCVSQEELNMWVNSLEAAIQIASPILFGVPLWIGFKKSGSHCPAPIQKALEYLDSHDAVSANGIFRISATGSVVQTLKEQFNKGVVPDFETFSEPHPAANILKLYLRELPDPLLTFDLFDSFVEATKSGTAVAEKLTALVTKLPHVNRFTLYCLMSYLTKVSARSSENLMTSRNLAVVFGPTILRPREETMAIAANSEGINYVCESMINSFDTIFAGVPKEIADWELKQKEKAALKASAATAATPSAPQLPPTTATATATATTTSTTTTPSAAPASTTPEDTTSKLRDSDKALRESGKVTSSARDSDKALAKAMKKEKERKEKEEKERREKEEREKKEREEAERKAKKEAAKAEKRDKKDKIGEKRKNSESPGPEQHIMDPQPPPQVTTSTPPLKPSQPMIALIQPGAVKLKPLTDRQSPAPENRQPGGRPVNSAEKTESPRNTNPALPHPSITSAALRGSGGLASTGVSLSSPALIAPGSVVLRKTTVPVTKKEGGDAPLSELQMKLAKRKEGTATATSPPTATTAPTTSTEATTTEASNSS